MKPNLNRREFFQRAGLSGAALTAVAAGLPRPAAAQDNQLAPFFHGVASGDPLSDRVILWTRVTPPLGHDGSPIAVQWQLALDAGLQQVVMSGEVFASAERDWTVKIDPVGLASFSYYFYRFSALGANSLIGRTKTAPAKGQPVDHLRLGVVSCANYQQGWFNAYARLSEREDLDAILHTGDYIYEYEDGGYGPGSAIGRGHEPPEEMIVLPQYRQRHGQYKQDPDLRRLHQLFPFVVTWDDHEFTDNSWRDGANNHNEGEGDWAARKTAAQKAYDEWMPLRSGGDPAIIYRSLSWGDLVDVVVMDTRVEGRDQQLTYPGTDTENLGALLITDASNPNRHIVSETQMGFVQDALSQSSAQWKLLMQQVIVSQWNMGGLPILPEQLASLDLPVPIRDGGNALNADAWDGYTADRVRLLDHISDNNIDNVVILTGDVHSSWAFDVCKDSANPLAYNPLNGDGSVAVEFVCPGVTSTSLGDTIDGIVPNGSSVFELAMRTDNRHLKYVDSVRNGYVVLDITPEHAQADWFFVNVDAPNDEQTTGESWRSLAASNKLIAADAPSTEKAPGPELTADSTIVTRGGSTGSLGWLSLLGGVALGGLFHRRRKLSEPD